MSEDRRSDVLQTTGLGSVPKEEMSKLRPRMGLQQALKSWRHFKNRRRKKRRCTSLGSSIPVDSAG